MINRTEQIKALINFLKEEYHADFLNGISCQNYPNMLNDVIRHEAQQRFVVEDLTDEELKHIKIGIKSE